MKKGDRCSPGNYRPISMLSVFDKMLEKLMYKRIISFLDKHDILNKHQFGFRTGHSTTHALVEVMDELYASLDDGNFALGVFLDLQKAFDTVLHDLLLDKMYHYGIRGLAHSWFQSYLSNRMQYVSLNGVVSEPRHIRHGVPQGSVLGPLLFLLFINDIANIDPRLKIKLFADDTNIFFYEANLPNLIINANVALDKVAEWLKANKLCLNIDKTNYFIFKTTCVNTDNIPDIVIDHRIIQRVDFCKYLGITLDCRLSFVHHINAIVSRVNQYCGIFYKLRNLLPVFCLRQLYFTLVYPHLLYGLEIYGNTSASILDPLLKVNNRILRILQNQSIRTPLSHLYSNFNILPITALRDLKIACLMHKYVHHPLTLPKVFHNYFTFNRDVHSHYTRTCSSLHFRSTYKSIGTRSLKYFGSSIWNNLPVSLRSISDYNLFKRRIDLIFKSKVYDYV